MKFYTGNKSKYNPELHSNGIYFTNDKNISTILAQGKEYGNNLHEVLWQELKDLRDNSELTPGSLYRITDYQCTTTQQNTRSAGHQFDIVLLALSENKLTEEGWAMMHDNIYDVTFRDGIIKKCYYNFYDSTEQYICNLVECETFLGITDEELTNIDEINKTAECQTVDSTDLIAQNLPYNYFQNSNLSAWKVWYCLDNDTSRFAWADDNVIGDIENIVVYYPEETIFGQTIPAHDVVYTLTNETQIVNGVTYFKLTKLEVVHTGDSIDPDSIELFVNTKNINTETTLYDINSAFGTTSVNAITGISIKSINYNTPPTEEGRGVIYRLIDEWNNDCPYDFKNILFKRDKIVTVTDSYNNSFIFDNIQIACGVTSEDGQKNVAGYTSTESEYYYTFSLLSNDADVGGTVLIDLSTYQRSFTESEIDEAIDDEYSADTGDSCCNNKIMPTYFKVIHEEDPYLTVQTKVSLPNNVFVSTSSWDSTDITQREYCFFVGNEIKENSRCNTFLYASIQVIVDRGYLNTTRMCTYISIKRGNENIFKGNHINISDSQRIIIQNYGNNISVRSSSDISLLKYNYYNGEIRGGCKYVTMTGSDNSTSKSVTNFTLGSSLKNKTINTSTFNRSNQVIYLPSSTDEVIL